MVPAPSHKVSRVSWYSGSRSGPPDFAYGAFTLSCRSFQFRSAILRPPLMRSEPHSARTVVWALSFSLAATRKIDFSFFSSGYLDVSVHRVPPALLCIHNAVTEVPSAGFPHSDIHGSSVICTSPWLFAAYHVFLRLLVPRHPPCALLCLTFPSGLFLPSGLPHLAWCGFSVFLSRFVDVFSFLSSLSVLVHYSVFKVQLPASPISGRSGLKRTSLSMDSPLKWA